MEDLFIKAMGRYGSTIRGVVVRRVGMETPDWEDIVSEVYLSLWRALNNGFRGDCSLGTFIYVIINRRVADYFRGCYRSKEEVPILFPLVSGTRSVEEEYETREIREILIKRLGELEREYNKYAIKNKFRQKEVTVLYFKGYQRRDIAEELGMGYSAVCACLNRVGRKLKKYGGIE